MIRFVVAYLVIGIGLTWAWNERVKTRCQHSMTYTHMVSAPMTIPVMTFVSYDAEPVCGEEE